MTIAIKDLEEKIPEEKERLAVSLCTTGDADIISDIKAMRMIRSWLNLNNEVSGA